MFLTRQTHTHLYSQFGTRIGYSIHKAARPYTRRGSRRVLRPAIARRVHLPFLPVAVCLNSEAGETADARLASHAAAFLQLGNGPQAERGCRYSRCRGRQPHKNTTAKLHSMPADKEMQDEPRLARSDISQQLFKSSDLNPESMIDGI
jgi:hypothetical protein